MGQERARLVWTSQGRTTPIGDPGLDGVGDQLKRAQEESAIERPASGHSRVVSLIHTYSYHHPG